MHVNPGGGDTWEHLLWGTTERHQVVAAAAVPERRRVSSSLILPRARSLSGSGASASRLVSPSVLRLSHPIGHYCLHISGPVPSAPLRVSIAYLGSRKASKNNIIRHKVSYPTH